MSKKNRSSAPSSQKSRAAVKAPSATNNRVPSLVLLFLVLVTGAILYWQILDNPPLFDSKPFAQESQLQGTRDAVANLSLRCVAYSTFYGIYLMSGMDLSWQYAFNLFIHLANSLLVFFFYRTFFTNMGVSREKHGIAPDRAALFAAAIFCLHPVAVYGTADMIQRTIEMGTTFSLFSCWLFLLAIFQERKLFAAASAISYMMAVYCKEHTAPLPAVLFVLMALAERARGITIPKAMKKWWWFFFLCALVLLFVVLQRKQILTIKIYEPHGRVVQELGVQADTAVHEGMEAYHISVLAQMMLFFKYALLWVVPYLPWISPDILYLHKAKMWAMPETLFAPLFLAVPVAAYFLMRRSKLAALAGFALLAPWLLFSTELSVARIAEAFVLYRSYYWAPFALAIVPVAIAAGCRVVPALSKVWFVPALALLVGFAFLTKNRLDTFESPEAYWGDAALKLPEDSGVANKSYRAHNNYGEALIHANKLEAAIYHMEKAVKIRPDYAIAFNNLGVAHLKLGHLAESEASYRRVLEINDKFADAYIGIGVVMEKMGRLDESFKYYQKALEINPRNQHLYYNLGNAYSTAKKYEQAKGMYQQALTLNPNFYDAYLNLGSIAAAQGRLLEAIEHYRKAQSIYNGDWRLESTIQNIQKAMNGQVIQQQPQTPAPSPPPPVEQPQPNVVNQNDPAAAVTPN